GPEESPPNGLDSFGSSAVVSPVAATVAVAPQLLLDGGNWVLDVWVAENDAVLVAHLAAANRIVVVGAGGH
ncbi:MAG: hypothetical protein LBH11_04355, partial [Propionibacteriaceae bacterium]|nr:hypothetical protein [Propionibacteriaceae bacterium]